MVTGHVLVTMRGSIELKADSLEELQTLYEGYSENDILAEIYNTEIVSQELYIATPYGEE